VRKSITNSTERFAKHGLLLTALMVWPTLSSSQPERYSGFFAELEQTRDEAYRAAVVSVTREALGNLLRDENWNPELLACLERWIGEELAPDYRFLVSNALFDIDQAMRDQWALEGNMRIEMGFLNRWVREQLTNASCGPELQQRRTIYIEPGDPTDEQAGAAVAAARNHVQQVFSRNGYQFVDDTRRQYAEFRLVLDSAAFSARGPVKTMNVTGLYVDNRIDSQPYLAINASVDERLRTTELALDDALLERQAQEILAQVREWEAAHVVEEHDVEIVFVSRGEREDRAEQVLAEVVTRLDLPADFSERADALQVTSLDGGRIEISIFIPARYGVSLSRSRMHELRSIARELLEYDVAASEFSDNATRLTIVDASAIQATWEREFWQYLDSGQLVVPESQSALAIVRRQLATDADDRTALGFLDEIVGRLVQRAIYKLGQDALSSANSDLTLAESIGADRPVKPWVSARRELDAAIARQRARIQAEQQTPPARPRPPAAEAPLVLFPGLESWASRAISVQPTRGILGVTADLQGIKSIEINGSAVSFGPAADANSGYLSVPGAVTQEFYLPPNLTADGAELRVVVVDGDDDRTVRVLLERDNAYVVSAAPESAGNADSATLKEGDTALNGVYHALIIANQNYERVNDLETPLRDAEVLASVLVDYYNFGPDRIYRVVDGTRADIEAAIDRLQDVVGPNDSLLIYFAGHGYQDRGHAGTGYWIPVDGRGPDEPGHRTSWVPNIFIADYVEKVKARHVLLISDSCYAGTFAQRGLPDDYFIATSEYARQKAGLDSRRAITSGDVEPVRDTGGNGHSIFAYHLLEVLREQPGEYLTAEQLYKAVFRPVRDAAPQVPQYFVMSDNDEGGDFVFVRKNR
jgi:hypothetical protein